jgi:hypothetical protein
MMGEPFFDCQIGFVGCRAMCLKGILGVKDFEEHMNRSETVSQDFALVQDGCSGNSYSNERVRSAWLPLSVACKRPVLFPAFPLQEGLYLR